MACTSERVKTSTPIGTSLAQHRDAQNGTEAAQSLRFDQCVFGIGSDVGNMDDSAFKLVPALIAVPRSGLDWNSSDVLHELVGEAVSLPQR